MFCFIVCALNIVFMQLIILLGLTKNYHNKQYGNTRNIMDMHSLLLDYMGQNCVPE